MHDQNQEGGKDLQSVKEGLKKVLASKNRATPSLLSGKGELPGKGEVLPLPGGKKSELGSCRNSHVYRDPREKFLPMNSNSKKKKKKKTQIEIVLSKDWGASEIIGADILKKIFGNADRG